MSNYSLDFDSASSQYLNFGTSLGDSIGDNYTDSISFSLWFKANTTTGDDGLIWWSSSSPSNGELSVWIQSNNINVQMYGGSTQSYSFTDTTNWHHLVVILKPSGSKMYLDNVDTGLSWTYSDLDVNNNTFYLGTYYSTSYTFDGNITEASVFDYELSASQVTELYGTGSAIGNPMAITNGRKPVAYYPLSNAAFNSEFLVPNSAEQDFVFDFDGTNDYINCGNDSSLNITNNITISAWIKADSFGTYNLIIGKSTNKDYDFGTASIGGNNVIRFHTGDGTQEYVDSSGISLVTGLWYQVAIVRTTTPNQVTFFVNGEQLNTVSLTRTPIGSTDITRIGSRSGSFSFDGSISNVSIFDSALPATGTESVESLYNYGTPPNIASYSNLQGWWELDASATFDGSNWSIPDASGNSNTGTSSGMTAASLTQSDLIINQSYDPFSLSFDGTDDRVGFTSSIDLGTTNTISLWLRNEVSQDRIFLGEDSYSGDYHILGGYNHFIVRVGGSYNVLSTGSVPIIPIASNWSHVVFIRNGDDVSLYINGYLSASSNTWNGGSPSSNVSKFDSIGAKPTGGTSWLGKISNVSTFNSELSAAQVQTLYNEGKPFDLNTFAVTPTNWWRLGAVNSSFDGTNWTVLDEIGTSNGTSANMTQADLVDGVGATGSGTSSGMSSGTNKTGDAPYSSNNAVSYNMSVTAKSTSVPT